MAKVNFVAAQAAVAKLVMGGKKARLEGADTAQAVMAFLVSGKSQAAFCRDDLNGYDSNYFSKRKADVIKAFSAKGIDILAEAAEFMASRGTKPATEDTQQTTKPETGKMGAGLDLSKVIAARMAHIQKNGGEWKALDYTAKGNPELNARYTALKEKLGDVSIKALHEAVYWTAKGDTPEQVAEKAGKAIGKVFEAKHMGFIQHCINANPEFFMHKVKDVAPQKSKAEQYQEFRQPKTEQKAEPKVEGFNFDDFMAQAAAADKPELTWEQEQAKVMIAKLEAAKASLGEKGRDMVDAQIAILKAQHNV